MEQQQQQDQQKDSLYWASLYQQAEKAASRKEAVSILREAQRVSDRARFKGYQDRFY